MIIHREAKQSIFKSQMQISFSSLHLTPISQQTSTFSQIHSINMFVHNEAARRFVHEATGGFLGLQMWEVRFS
jgi:hypothetical protein